MGDKGTIELTEEGAKLVPYDPIEDYGYPLESWPKDTKDVFVAQRKDDPLADIGTARRQPQRQQITALLQNLGINVTRRTVAKYREDMKIPSTHQRRVRN